eukprot:4165184-Amphidinium_carterae.3
MNTTKKRNAVCRAQRLYIDERIKEKHTQQRNGVARSQIASQVPQSLSQFTQQCSDYGEA